MLDRIKQWLFSGAAFAIGVMYLLLQLTRGQRDTARQDAQDAKQEADTAKERIKQRQEADRASSQAKNEGDKRIEEALERARAGDRSHFERGLRDDD